LCKFLSEITALSAGSGPYLSSNPEFDKIPEHMPNKWDKTGRKQAKKEIHKIYKP